MTRRHVLFAFSLLVVSALAGYKAFASFGQNPKMFGIMAGIQQIGVGGQSVTPTWPLEVGGTWTAKSAVADGVSVHPTLKASANSDVLNGIAIAPTFTDGSFSGVTHYALNATGTVKATLFSGSGASLTNLPAGAVPWTTPGTIGSVTPNTGAFTTLASTGATTLGSAGGGTAFTAAGACTIASTTISNTVSDVTCTGVPASAAIAVRCTGQAAFSTATGNSVYCRATGTVDQVECNTALANTTAMAYSCSWTKP